MIQPGDEVRIINQHDEFYGQTFRVSHVINKPWQNGVILDMRHGPLNFGEPYYALSEVEGVGQ